MYNLNYAPTTLGVQSRRENTSGDTRTKKVECSPALECLDHPQNCIPSGPSGFGDHFERNNFAVKLVDCKSNGPKCDFPSALDEARDVILLADHKIRYINTCL
jgi:hypothetical protein